MGAPQVVGSYNSPCNYSERKRLSTSQVLVLLKQNAKSWLKAMQSLLWV